MVVTNTKLNNMKETKIFLILDEDTLSFVSLNGNILKFQTFEDANAHARRNLHLWQIVEVWFNDKHVHHLPNVKSEYLIEVN